MKILSYILPVISIFFLLQCTNNQESDKQKDASNIITDTTSISNQKVKIDSFYYDPNDSLIRKEYIPK